MSVRVSIEVVSPRILAAVRRKATIGEIGAVWKAPLDQVWTFLRTQPGLRTDGHNVFLYHHPARRSDPMDIDFGVEVVREFPPSGEVKAVKTPEGEVAVATHIGPYDRLRHTHDAIHDFARANNRTFAGQSWEIYGDWTDDPAKLETTVMYLLA